MDVKPGTLRAFDSATYKATVEIAGSFGVYLGGLAVARNIAAAQMVNGRRVAVLFLDASNPDDAVVIAVWT